MEPDPPCRRARALSLACLLPLLPGCIGGTRIEKCVVPPAHVAILTRLDGQRLPPGTLIAPAAKAGEAPWQGVQLEVLHTGMHPAVTSEAYRWEIVPMIDVPPDSVGVLVRLFGEPLPPGRVLADEDPADAAAGVLRRGILGRTLGPGAHAINTRAYEVTIAPRVTLGPGEVGVVTRLVGPSPSRPSDWLAQPGERGVQPAPLPPGSHDLNPYVDVVTAWSRESQRIDLTTPGRRVRFPTQDGFDIALNGTLEWSVPEDKAAALFARFGALPRVLEILLMPATRAVSRQHGVETAVRDFISGSRRLEFQNALQQGVAALVEPEGARVHSMTIAGVEPPQALAEIVQQREAAVLARAHHVAEVEKANSYHEVLRKELIKARPDEVVKAKKAALDALAAAKQKSSEQEIAREAERGRLAAEREKSKLDADAIQRGSLADVVTATRATELMIASLAPRIAAHGGGMQFARALLIEKVAPRLREVEADIASPLGAPFAGLAAAPSQEKKP